METSGVGSSSAVSSGGGQNDALRGLELGNFIELMVTELQNQDPLDPMENTEILQQISQIREIDVSERMGNTLDAVLAGQNFASASSMVGKHVRALTENNGYTEGTVDSVSIANGDVQLHIGEDTVELGKVAEIYNQRPDDDSDTSGDEAAADDSSDSTADSSATT
jgi:flagellar basal-body rod modification protein FlgD